MTPAQPDLFSPSGSVMPEGLAYRSDILARSEESGLAGQFAALDLKPFEFHELRGQSPCRFIRDSLRFCGWRVAAGSPHPRLPAAAAREGGSLRALEPQLLPHALVTEYSAGIGWHRDRPIFEDVIGVSLVSECRFRLRRRKGTGWERASLLLEPRSIYLLRGPARRDWEHSIAAGDRPTGCAIFVIFRSLRRTEGP